MAAKKTTSKPKATPTPPGNDGRPKNTGKPLDKTNKPNLSGKTPKSANAGSLRDRELMSEAKNKRNYGTRKPSMGQISSGSKTGGKLSGRAMRGGKRQNIANSNAAL